MHSRSLSFFYGGVLISSSIPKQDLVGTNGGGIFVFYVPAVTIVRRFVRLQYPCDYGPTRTHTQFRTCMHGGKTTKYSTTSQAIKLVSTLAADETFEGYSTSNKLKFFDCATCQTVWRTEKGSDVCCLWCHWKNVCHAVLNSGNEQDLFPQFRDINLIH